MSTEVHRAQAVAGTGISVAVLLRCFLRCYLVGAAFNTRGMQNVGLAFAVDPGLVAVHGHGPELRQARKRHVGHYNTHPFWTPLIVGVFLSTERKIARDLFPVQVMENVRGTMVYTLSAIGDSFFGGSVLVCWSLTTACLLVMGMPNLALGLGAACFTGLQCFKAVTLWYGFREGFTVLQRLKRWRLIDWGQRVKMINGALLAFLWYLVWPVRLGVIALGDLRRGHGRAGGHGAQDQRGPRGGHGAGVVGVHQRALAGEIFRLALVAGRGNNRTAPVFRKTGGRSAKGLREPRRRRVAADQGLETEIVTADVRVRNELGLHARPAAKLAQTAQRFEADITLAVSDQQVDAKSILDVLTLAAPGGTSLSIRARGADARQAVDSLLEMFRNRFGEDK